MRVTVTGATGRIGPRLVAALRERGDEVTVLSRTPDARRAPRSGVEAVALAARGRAGARRRRSPAATA